MTTKNDTQRIYESLQAEKEQLLKELWQKRDYAGILEMKLPTLGRIYVGDQLFSDIIPELVRECPPDILKQHPITLLRYAYILNIEAQFKQGLMLMQTLYDSFEKEPDPEKRNTLLGEWMFVKSISSFPNISDMLEAIEESFVLTGGHTEVLNSEEPFMIALTSPIDVFNTKEGCADEQGRQFTRFVELYEQMTDGGGYGAPELYMAGLHYYRGELKEAELYCYKAIYLAESKRQAIIQMGAASFLAQISINKMDIEMFTQALEIQNQAIEINTKYKDLLHNTFEFLRADLYFGMNVADGTPDWIKKGAREILPAVVVPYTKYMQLRYFFCCEKYEQAIGLGEALLSHIQHSSVEIRTATEIYVAFSYIYLGYKEKGLELFKKVLPPIFKDKLYTIFIIFYEYLKGALDDYLKETYPDDVDKIFEMMEHSRQGRLKFIHIYLDAESGLTRKEKEVALLVSQGLQNKEISEKLNISVNTVRAHLRSVFAKLEVTRRTDIGKRLE